MVFSVTFSHPSRYSRGLRRLSLLTSATFLWTTLLSMPAQVLAHDNKPHFSPPKPIPTPLVHDDPSWHTLDYHKMERAAIVGSKNGQKAASQARLVTMIAATEDSPAHPFCA